MTVPRWRRAIAFVVDVCVGGVPALVLLAGWAAVVQGTAEAGIGALLYYGVPLALFTGTGIIWAYWTWRAHRGMMPVRSVGLVVGGMRYADGALTRERLRPLTFSGAALHVGAAAMATVHVLVVAFAIYQVAFLVWTRVIG